MNFSITLSLIILWLDVTLSQFYYQNCLNYTSGLCTKCSNGYYLTKGECILSCIDNCSLCLTKNNCQQCLNGYYLSSNNSTCIKCSSPCNSCRINKDNILCNKCNNLDWDGSKCSAFNLTKPYCLQTIDQKCPTCSNLCKTCYLDSSKQNICSECVDNAVFNSTNVTNCYCKPGYTAISNQCKSCKELYGRYCTSCSSTKCLSCFSRNGCVLFSEQNTCICDSKLESNYNKVYQVNPITLSSNTSIKYFVPNSNCYALDSSGNCVIKCTDVYDEKCLNCDDGGCIESFVGSTTYKTCPKLSYAPYSSYSCIKCTNYYPSCYDCSNSECLLCQVNGKIKQCPCKHENMYLSDSDLAIFNTSYFGYKLSCNDCYTQGAYCKNYVKLGICSDYLPYCSKCNGSICSECQSGYYLDNDGSCKSCQKYDQMCTDCDTTSCLTCNNTNINMTCNACNIKNCNVCIKISTTSKTCTECYTGFYFNIGKCNSCKDYGNCEICKLNQGCNFCSPGYKLDRKYGIGRCDVLCNTIFDKCIKCDSEGCLNCDEGYYLNDDSICSSCNDKFPMCSSCNYENCTTCIENAELAYQGQGCKCKQFFFDNNNSCTSIAYPIIISAGIGLMISFIIYCCCVINKRSRVLVINNNPQIMQIANNNEIQRNPLNYQSNNFMIQTESNEKALKKAVKNDLKRIPTKEIADDELCHICLVNKADKCLECLHILCSNCLKEEIRRKYSTCPFCRREVDFTKATNYTKIYVQSDKNPINPPEETEKIDKKL